MSELDTLLESGFQEAANRETFARQIEAKIKEIPGAAALIPARRYGEPVNAEKIRASLTLRSLIEAKSPQLAVYFGLDAGVAHRRLEEKEARELLKQRMQMLTEKSRAANEPVSYTHLRARLNLLSLLLRIHLRTNGGIKKENNSEEGIPM